MRTSDIDHAGLPTRPSLQAGRRTGPGRAGPGPRCSGGLRPPSAVGRLTSTWSVVRISGSCRPEWPAVGRGNGPPPAGGAAINELANQPVRASTSTAIRAPRSPDPRPRTPDPFPPPSPHCHSGNTDPCRNAKCLCVPHGAAICIPAPPQVESITCCVVVCVV